MTFPRIQWKMHVVKRPMKPVGELWLCLLAAVAGTAFLVSGLSGQESVADGESGDTKSPEDWVEWLGSLEFAERVQAETALRNAGRGAIAALSEAVKSEDPQIRLSAQRILDHILSDPSNIPTKFRSLIPGDRKIYAVETEKWRVGVETGSSNVDGRQLRLKEIEGCGAVGSGVGHRPKRPGLAGAGIQDPTR